MPEQGSRAWRSIPDRVLAQAAAKPDAVAVETADASLGYAMLAKRMERYASLLADRLQGHEPLVAVCLDRDVNLPVWLLAILRAGAAYLPLDATLPPARTAQMLSSGRPDLILVSAALLGTLPRVETPVVTVEELCEAKTPVSPLQRNTRPDGLAYVMYTSGSTGVPKGVEIEQRSITALLDAIRDEPGLAQGERMLALTRISFDLSVLELFLPLVSGASIVLATADDARDPARLTALLERFRPALMQATPAAYRGLLESGWDGFVPRMLCGGEAMTPILARRLLDRCSELWNVYGPTETTVWSTAHRVRDASVPIAVGVPIDGATIALVDDSLLPVASGSPGEIVIGGPGVARGYRGAPDLTAQRFVTLRGGDRVYRTGDIGRIGDGGLLYCHGRSDDQVKVRGFRIELGDVEQAIAEYSSIGWSAARAWPAADGETSLAGYIVPSSGAAIEIPQLKSFLGERLPPYMIPDRFVTMDRLPQTASGKIDRKALPDPFGTSNYDSAGRPTGVREQLGAIWRDILSVQSVGDGDDFFDLGGYSLLTVRLQRQIEQQFGRSIALSALMQASTLADMAALVERDDFFADDGVFRLHGKGPRAPLFWLDGGPLMRGMARAMGDDQPVWSINLTREDEAAFGDGPLDLSAVAAVLRKRLVRAHPNGPYFIGGWCRWGVVAHELACQLRERGRTVGLLVLLDAEAPAGLGARLSALRRWWRSENETTGEAPSFSQRVETASHRHRARVFEGPALLLRPSASSHDAGGWRTRISGDFKIAGVPGDHLTMVRPPHVAALANVVDDMLRAAQEKAVADGRRRSPGIRSRTALGYG